MAALIVTLNFFCSLAVCYSNLSLQTLLTLRQHTFLSFLPLPIQDVSSFCQILAPIHCATTTVFKQVYPLLWKNPSVWEPACFWRLSCFIVRRSGLGRLYLLLPFLLRLCFLVSIEFVKGMPGKRKLVITSKEPTVHANLKTTAYSLYN